KLISNEVPRIHEFVLPDLDNQQVFKESGGRIIRTVSLTAPSGAANRAVGGMEAYKIMKARNTELTTVDFRAMQYKKFFSNSLSITDAIGKEQNKGVQI